MTQLPGQTEAEALEEVVRLVEKHGRVDIEQAVDGPSIQSWLREVCRRGAELGVHIKADRLRIWGPLIHTNHEGEASDPAPVVAAFDLLPLPVWEVTHVYRVQARTPEAALRKARNLEPDSESAHPGEGQ